MHGEVEKLHDMIVAQNTKIATLSQELASLKQTIIMEAVERQVAEKGHGGTA